MLAAGGSVAAWAAFVGGGWGGRGHPGLSSSLMLWPGRGEGEEGQEREFQAVVSELATGPWQFSPGAGRVLL